MREAGSDWWRDAIIYQVYPRSFLDTDGDGIGDLAGVRRGIDHLAYLGVDALWLCPFYPSPQVDGGYDVTDYQSVEPELGDLGRFDEVVDAAHACHIRVLVDLIPNHTSDRHPWFRSALEAAPGAAARSVYWFRDGSGPSGSEPPNSWPSVFGGAAWTRVSDRADAPGTPWADDGQWYLHSFDAAQPDLDWDAPAVRERFESILRFWFDRGVDGFRIDVAHGLVKTPRGASSLQMRSSGATGAFMGAPNPELSGGMFDQDGVHEIYRRWRRLADGYSPRRVFVAEANVSPERASRYVRPDELHQAFNFPYSEALWSVDALRTVIDRSLRAMETVGAPVTWVTSNHDIVRVASRLGLPDRPGAFVAGIGPDDVQPDAVLGLRRARALALVTLALPGSVYIYQGEELGLPEHTTLRPEDRRDPKWFRSQGAQLGRDGCRVPIPWSRDAPAHGFSPTGECWLPQPSGWGEYAIDAQRGEPRSTLELYRAALRHRRVLGLGTGSLHWASAGPRTEGILTFINGRIQVVANLGPEPLSLPPHREILLASTPFDPGRGMPTDTAVWLTTIEER